MKVIKEINLKELAKSRFEITEFFMDLSREDQEHALKALSYSTLFTDRVKYDFEQGKVQVIGDGTES